MYLNILKRDLKRKKTMNMILLLFVLLASMFVSSGLSNVIAVMNGTDHYLEKAGVGEYEIVTMMGDGGVIDILNQSEYVNYYRADMGYWGTKDSIFINDKPVVVKSTNIEVQIVSENGMIFFTSDNEEITSVNPGEVYVTAGMLKSNNASIGDCLTIDFYGTVLNLKIVGEMKDAFLGSEMMGNTRYLISEEDFSQLKKDELEPYLGYIFFVDTDDVDGLKAEMTSAQNIIFATTIDTVKISYVMEMIIAMIVLVLSLCLCIVSFVLLKFVITFTISEEFREIGVMKAIGIHNFKIRSIYLIKYLVMSLIGDVVGLAAGIPFGNMLIKSVSEKMVLSTDYGILINIFGSVLVVIIMTGFAFLCTAKIKTCTPLDAIRSGATGERYGKKAKISIKKIKCSNALFLAINDVLSSPKRFLIIIFTFFLCSIFVFGVVEVTDTMLSDRLITVLGRRADVYITSGKLIDKNLMSIEGNELKEETLQKIEEDFEALGMPGTASYEVWFKYNVYVDGVANGLNCLQNTGADTSEYEYTEGTPPQNDGEIAITDIISKEIGAKIGDTVIIDYGTEKKECVVVAYFQSLNQLGSVIRIHQDAPTDMQYANAIGSLQIVFDDNPSDKVIEERIEILKEYYDTSDIFDATGYCDDSLKVASTLSSVKLLLLVISGIVVILVTVLMERSFISDETSQIALLKSIGFRDSFIIRWQVYRFFIVALISEIFAVALTYPITKLWCDPIWKMMGASHVDYYFKPLSLVVIYPGILLIINLVSVYMTTRIAKKITSNDIGNVE